MGLLGGLSMAFALSIHPIAQALESQVFGCSVESSSNDINAK
jgi:hypothetical protein